MIRRFVLILLITSLVLVAACSKEEDAPVPLPEISGVATLVDENEDPRVVEVSLSAGSFTDTLGGEVALDLMGYNGGAPGPLIQARVGDEVIAHFTNNLAEPTTIHWHGLRISDDMDGSPRVQTPVQPGETFTYRFVAPEAGTFWYHPHVRGYEQVERGLYGPMVIHGENDPVYDAERYVILDDILLDGAGQIAPFLTSHHEQMHGRSGNNLLTNGQLSDPLQFSAEAGRVERWRILNAANARTMEISLDGASFRVIGTDGGLLPAPYTTERLIVAVGQRYDIEVTYGAAGAATLLTHVLAQENGEIVEVALPVAEVAIAASDIVPRPIEWPTDIVMPQREVDDTVLIRFNATTGPDGNMMWTLNGEAHREDPLFTFQQGQTVRIFLDNELGPEHPFHLHGQFFQVVGGAEPGLKDTVLVPGLAQVEIEAYLDNPGRWMAHCHILEHAELGMMSEIVVEPTDTASE